MKGVLRNYFIVSSTEDLRGRSYTEVHEDLRLRYRNQLLLCVEQDQLGWIENPETQQAQPESPKELLPNAQEEALVKIPDEPPVLNEYLEFYSAFHEINGHPLSTDYLSKNHMAPLLGILSNKI